MYTILVNEDNSLVTTQKERIVQRSKLVDTLHFLVPIKYKDFDMRDFQTVNLQYTLPVSKEAYSELLTPSKELYKNDYIEFKLPLDTSITKEAGKVELTLVFYCVTIDADGKSHQYVRRTTPGTITVVACTNWCNVIPDHLLDSLDQRLIALTSLVEAIDEESQLLYETKADNLTYDPQNNTLRLTANQVPIGNAVDLSELEDDPEDPHVWEII